ncbi:MAG: Rne/Rng family ribonuclease [Propionibacteriaceae bacterium]
MLNEDIATSISNDDLPRPPAGRRSARRPAGPPVTVTATAPETESVKPKVKPETNAEPKKAPTRRRSARRPAGAPTATAPVVEPSVVVEVASVSTPEASGNTSEVTEGKKPQRARRATTRKTAGPKKVKNLDDAIAELESDIQPIISTIETVMASSSDDEPAARAPRKTTRRTTTRRPRRDNDVVLAEPETVELPVADSAAVAVVAETVEKSETRYSGTKRQPRKRVNRSRQASQDSADTAIVLPELPHAESVVELSAEDAAAALAELTAAIAERTSGAVVTAAAEESDEVDLRDDSDDDAMGDQPRRRRRRRGGRRRRRELEDSDTDDVDADNEEDSNSEEPSQVTADEVEVASVDSESTDSEADGDDTEAGTRRRRRRRRRRGEGVDGSDDDPDTEIVVRVREPRARRQPAAAPADEVAGIEGSTRLEAKRQRRREGRHTRRRSPILSEAEFLARRESVDRVMVIRQKEEYTQIGVLEDGILAEHYVDRATSTALIGNIYLGRVQNVLPSMEAAFIDIGRGRNAVLYAGEVNWDAFGAEGHDRKMENVFKSGQSVLVQVTKDPVGQKGARLTSHISLPGRYLVYSPGGELSGISRKLADTERERLRDILGHLISDEASVIVRTAAEGISEEELVLDVNRLTAQWEAIQKESKIAPAPSLLYSEPDATVRTVRDLFTEDFSKLIIDGHGGENDAWQALESYVSNVAPHLIDRLERWDRSKQGDIFTHYRLDEQIAKALERKVFLPSGGSLVIDRTEAMTVIDVNTGKFTGTGGNLEATVTSNNLEAAEEVVRQLRLRDIGGIIVIDFIDMVLPSNRELLLRRLVECLGRDRTRHQVAEVTSLGLVQMTRKKIGTGLAEAFTQECETCKGRGYHRHEEPVETQAPADGGDRLERKAAHRRSTRKISRKKSTEAVESDSE